MCITERCYVFIIIFSFGQLFNLWKQHVIVDRYPVPFPFQHSIFSSINYGKWDQKDERYPVLDYEMIVQTQLR